MTSGRYTQRRFDKYAIGEKTQKILPESAQDEILDYMRLVDGDLGEKKELKKILSKYHIDSTKYDIHTHKTPRNYSRDITFSLRTRPRKAEETITQKLKKKFGLGRKALSQSTP